MHKCRLVYQLGVSAVAVSTLAACSSSTGTPTSSTQGAASTSAAISTPAYPTLTASSLQPPSQDNQYTKSSGRPKVTFDPCTWIPDDAISKIGFDPATRQRGNDIVAEQTFLTCDFSNKNDELQLDSGNVSLDDVKQKYAGRTQTLTINSRAALLTPNKTSTEDCSVDMQTKAGYFGVTFIRSTQGGLAGIQPCDHIVDAATALEPYLGKDN